MEYDLLAWNMGRELNRQPMEEEVQKRLWEEILANGNSHSKRCRTFCILANSDWFYKKPYIPDYSI